MSVSVVGGMNWPLPSLGGASSGQNLPSSSGALDDTSGTDDTESAAQKFIQYANENPIQRWLQEHGITQKEWDAMSADQKQKLLAEIKQEIEEKMKERIGAAAAPSVDMTV